MKKGVMPQAFNIILGIIILAIIIFSYWAAQANVKNIQNQYVSDVQSQKYVESYVPMVLKLNSSTFTNFTGNIEYLHDTSPSFFMSDNAIMNFKLLEGQILVAKANDEELAQHSSIDPYSDVGYPVPMYVNPAVYYVNIFSLFTIEGDAPFICGQATDVVAVFEAGVDEAYTTYATYCLLRRQLP